METMVVRAAEETFTVAERTPVRNSQELLAEIHAQLGEATAGEVRLEHSWMKLGKMLTDFKNGEHWRAIGFSSFGEFMVDLGNRYNRGRTQLWAYLNVHEELSPIIPPATLEEIGISKANEIRRQLKRANGKKLPDEIIEAAKRTEVTAKEIRAMLCVAFSTEDDRPAGTWFDFDGCYMTKEERAEFVAAVKVTMTLLEIKQHVPEHIQRKEIFMAWMREFMGTHANEVYGTPQPPIEPKLLMQPKPVDEVRDSEELDDGA